MDYISGPMAHRVQDRPSRPDHGTTIAHHRTSRRLADTPQPKHPQKPIPEDHSRRPVPEQTVSTHRCPRQSGGSNRSSISMKLTPTARREASHRGTSRRNRDDSIRPADTEPDTTARRHADPSIRARLTPETVSNH